MSVPEIGLASEMRTIFTHKHVFVVIPLSSKGKADERKERIFVSMAYRPFAAAVGGNRPRVS